MVLVALVSGYNIWNRLLTYVDHFLNVLMVKDEIVRCGMHKQCLLQASTVSTLADISAPDDEGNIHMQIRLRFYFF